MTVNRPSTSTVVCRDARSASLEAAKRFIAQIQHNPKSVLGLATGGSPVETYRFLIEAHQRGDVDFSSVTTFNLDEYLGLAAGHRQSFRYFMQQQLFDHINVPLESTFVPDGLAIDVANHCASYELMIRQAGGIDLQLLGIGHNGHIAFNEPGSAMDSRTRQVSLTPETIEKNARFFDSIDEVPRHAITMGIGTIMEARKIVLVAFGEAKADAVSKMLLGPIDESHPASVLQTHANVTVIMDEAAASGLS